MKNILLSVFCTLLFFPAFSHAQDAIVDDAFDPFADYSDFIEATTEETDINFFKFGRMISVGAQLGTRNFTGELGDIFGNSTYFGGFFTYYMSIQFAAQISYTSGSHSASFTIPTIDESFDGTARLGMLSVHGKYFLNTQNFTKAVSRFNPYVIGGFSQITRDITNFQTATLAGDSSGSFDFGVGAEYVFNSRRNFVALQLMYYSTDFPNESRNIVVTDDQGDPFTTDIKPAGDMLTFSIMLGINY